MRTASRVLWAIAGILLMVCGVVCLSQPMAALGTLSLLLGIVMLFSGVVDILIFVKGRNLMFGSGWFLADGLITVIFSLFLLFNQAFTTLTLPFIFGMWLLVSGISKFVNSFDLRCFGVRGWGWFTALGILLAVMGFCTLLDPVLGAVTLSVLVGVLLIVQGVASLLRACFSGRFLR